MALGLLIIAVFAFAVPYSKGYQRADKDHEADYAAHYAAERDYEKCSTKPTVEEAISCAKDAEKAYRENTRAEQDLDAQREMADWAEGMLWATSGLGLLSIAATGIGVAYVALTLREARKTTLAAIRGTVQARVANRQAKEAADATIAQTKEANELTKRNAAAELRPWVVVKIEVVRDIFFEDGKTVMRVRTQLQNIGNSPANRVRVARRIRSLNLDANNPNNTVSELEKYREARISSDGKQRESRYAIAPKNAIDIESYTVPIDAITNTSFNIVIFLSVTYEGAGIDGIADTHFAYLFRVKHPNGGLVSYTVKQETLKADQTGFQLVSGGFVT